MTLPPDIAWRLFTKGVSPREGERAAVIEGDRELAGAVIARVNQREAGVGQPGTEPELCGEMTESDNVG